jgi:hypothetical protein
MTSGNGAASAANGDARDSLTVLSTLGMVEEPGGRQRPRLATKRIVAGEDGKPIIDTYDDAKHFAVREVPVAGIRDLARILDRLQRCPRAFVIRGAPRPGIDRQRARRLAVQHVDPTTGELLEPTFLARARRWLAVDFDTLPLPGGFDWRDGELAALHLIRHLPGTFAGRSCVWTYTSGAGFKPELRMRLWFWLDRPVSEAEAGRWLAGCPVDRSLYRIVQPHYTAAPILEGLPPPVPRRLGLLEAFADIMPVPELPEPKPAVPPEPPPRRREPGAEPGRRYALAALASEADRVARTTPGKGAGHGRHAALFTGALRMRRFIDQGTLSCAEVTHDLISGALRAGLADSWNELHRTVANALTTAAEGRR